MRKSQVSSWGQSVCGYEAKRLDHFPGIRDAWRMDEMLARFLKKKFATNRRKAR